MHWNFEQITGVFSGDNSRLLLDGKWGIERESQRVTYSGELALTEHPEAFGSKLENPEVTVDFSESQLELITPPFPTVEAAHLYLEALQRRVEKELKNELLWPLSMPPRLPSEEEIPIARFEDTPEGREKEIYRLGLAARYGKKMQMISGIHFNFSFGEEMLNELYQVFGNGMGKRDFSDKVYFAAARNYLRYRWLLIYLFGASPSIDSTYYPVMHEELKTIAKCCPECCNPITGYENYSTSLRVSRFGYSNAVQGKYSVSFDSLKDYLLSVRKMLSSKSRKYTRLGTYRNGKQIQLNNNILQKESELYSSIRLKQVTAKGESQLEALEKRGVKYAEVRILDVNPFEKTGISLDQMRFLQVFMLFCLFEESKPIEGHEQEMINKNHHLVALSGRKQKLMLYQYGNSPVSLKEWGGKIFSRLEYIADLMDRATGGVKYRECVAEEYKKLLDISLLPSSRAQSEMISRGEGYLEFGIRKAMEHKWQDSGASLVYSTLPVCEMANANN